MCGRYTITTKYTKLVQRWQFPADDAGIQKLIPSYNIAPSQKVVVVWAGKQGNALTGMRWGLIPPWAKDASVGYKMINARAESVGEKPSFKKAFKEQRCLIIADGFYEWQKKGKEKQPVRIVLRSRELFAFAGVWSTWKEPESNKEIVTCAIVTCEANPLLKEVHDRMPVERRDDGGSYTPAQICRVNIGMGHGAVNLGRAEPLVCRPHQHSVSLALLLQGFREDYLAGGRIGGRNNVGPSLR